MSTVPFFLAQKKNKYQISTVTDEVIALCRLFSCKETSLSKGNFNIIYTLYLMSHTHKQSVLLILHFQAHSWHISVVPRSTEKRMYISMKEWYNYQGGFIKRLRYNLYNINTYLETIIYNLHLETSNF